jgi:hypothetical protein
MTDNLLRALHDAGSVPLMPVLVICLQRRWNSSRLWSVWQHSASADHHIKVRQECCVKALRGRHQMTLT